MPGFGNPIAVTKDRRTYLVVDAPRKVAIEPYFFKDLVGTSIHTGRPDKSDQVHYLPKIGWRLKAHQYDVSLVHEASVAASAIIDSSQATLAAAMFEYPSFRQRPLLDVGYSGDVQGSGSPFIVKRTGAGNSWDDKLDGDQSSFPGPDVPSHAPMDRVFVAAGNHSPDEPILFRFYVPGYAKDALHRLVSVYFTGPAGVDDTMEGSGRYCVTFWGDGRAELYELPVDTGTKLEGDDWVKRDEYMWTIPQLVSGNVHSVVITSDSTQDPDGRFTGTRILFRNAGHNNNLYPENFMDTVIALAINAIQQAPHDHVYEVPRRNDQPTTLAPIRIDVRRDVRVEFQVSKTSYPTEGFLNTDLFTFDFFPSVTNDIFVQIWGDFPTGTDIEIELHDIFTGEVTALTTRSGPGWREATFEPVQYSPGHVLGPAAQNYFVRLVFTGDADHTPTLRRVRVFRNAVYEETSYEPTEYGAPPADLQLPTFTIETLRVQGQGQDPSLDAATVIVEDIGNTFPLARVRAGFPVRVETTVDDLGTRSVLFSGYVSKTTSTKRMGDRGQAYPSKDWHGIVIEANGEWQRVRENFAPQRYIWTEGDAVGNNPAAKVTSIIRSLLVDASGYDPIEVDVEDDPMRLFATGNDDLTLEYGADVLDYIVGLANAYFGGRIVFDENAGTQGMWRLLFQKRAPYNNLCKFYRDHPGNGKVLHAPGAYGSSSETSPLGNEQEIVHTFIIGDTLRVTVEPPEGNFVKVVGSQSSSLQQKGSEDRDKENELAQATVANLDSYNFLGLDPSDPKFPTPDHPDYLGRIVPIVIVDPGIVGEDAIKWFARRVMEFAGVARRIVQFSAPLVFVTDVDDPLQVRPRRLRHYDPVLIQDENGDFEQFIVNDVHVEYQHDHVQVATYTCITTSAINNYAIT